MGEARASAPEEPPGGTRYILVATSFVPKELQNTFVNLKKLKLGAETCDPNENGDQYLFRQKDEYLFSNGSRATDAEGVGGASGT